MCGRCHQKNERNQLIHSGYFGCNRSKLPDFVHDFLPRKSPKRVSLPATSSADSLAQASMTLMHQKQTIEDTVKDQVLRWDKNRPLHVNLTSGYGPALVWKLYEFQPRTRDLLGQFQYLQNPDTGFTERLHKYSPPFGLMKLDASDDSRFEEYMEELLSPEYLSDFGWTCFEEECQVDPDHFQAKLLHMMCTLYTTTQDYDVSNSTQEPHTLMLTNLQLQTILKSIIRMLIITYIMGHTLTITDDTLSDVVGHVRHSETTTSEAPHTSPRLANRQLKFYFAVLRGNIYEKILKWQQQTLRTGGKKEDSWMTSFCAMLGFAMVLEEVQRTIQIQADAKAYKNEMPAHSAEAEASNACERIDERFDLLVGLFQCKYRDKTWGDNGSFGPQTPQLRDWASKNFLADTRMLLQMKGEALTHSACITKLTYMIQPSICVTGKILHSLQPLSASILRAWWLDSYFRSWIFHVLDYVLRAWCAQDRR